VKEAVGIWKMTELTEGWIWKMTERYGIGQRGLCNENDGWIGRLKGPGKKRDQSINTMIS